jgi:hypothetical protein
LNLEINSAIDSTTTPLFVKTVVAHNQLVKQHKYCILHITMWKKLRTLVYIATFLLTIATTSKQSSKCSVVVDAIRRDGGDSDTSKSILDSIKSQYDDLSPRGKMMTGAAVGFIGSRLALGTVAKVVKWGTGAFIV